MKEGGFCVFCCHYWCLPLPGAYILSSLVVRCPLREAGTGRLILTFHWSRRTSDAKLGRLLCQLPGIIASMFGLIGLLPIQSLVR